MSFIIEYVAIFIGLYILLGIVGRQIKLKKNMELLHQDFNDLYSLIHDKWINEGKGLFTDE